MADVFSAEKRSQIMRQVKSRRNLSTEEKLLAFFKANKITGWRRNFPLYGKPDFVFPRRRVVIFADGCFWHGHDCRNTRPADNQAYWEAKRTRNRDRDAAVNAVLAQKGWQVLRIWECEIKKGSYQEKVLGLLAAG